jgi:drug/metabolite transporter (DMT)-like permease
MLFPGLTKEAFMDARAVRLLLAFAAVYVIWGSTYLAIRVVVLSLPPALSAGIRFLVGGALMLGYALWRGGRLPRRLGDWRSTALTALAMLVGGNGLVTWSEQWVDSNQAALIVATAALWMAWMGTLGAGGERLGRATLAGLLLGFAGVALLVGGGLSAHLAPWYAYAALQLAAFLWALGSVYSKRRPTAASPWIAAALQMLVAGVVLSGIGVALGEPARWQWEPRSLWALGYLIVFGSCVAYGAYFWLVHEVPPAQLATYAYVNPAIAVVLGWWLLDERLGRVQVLGTLVILAGVVMVTLGHGKAARTRTA